jgi:hypothetical protein
MGAVDRSCGDGVPRDAYEGGSYEGIVIIGGGGGGGVISARRTVASGGWRTTPRESDATLEATDDASLPTRFLGFIRRSMPDMPPSGEMSDAIYLTPGAVNLRCR